MSKRITYLQRRTGLPTAEFSEHWRRAHAQIAVGLPGVVGYRQHHVLAGAAPEAATFSIDGIVELWFTSADVAHAGTTSQVSDRLIEDEPRFLSGLTGAPVTAAEPAPLTAFALWFLGWPRDGSDESLTATGAIAEAMSTLPGAGPATVNTLEPSGRLLVRERLAQMPSLPSSAVSVGFEDREALQQAERVLGQQLASLAAECGRSEVLTADVVPIIERAR